MEAVPSPAAVGTVAELLSAWGLEPGTAVAGWTCRSVSNVDEHGVAKASFERGEQSLDVRLRCADEERCLVRIGDVALSHGAVAEDLQEEAGDVVIVIAEWLNRHDGGVELARLLADVPAKKGDGDDAGESAGSVGAPSPARPGFGAWETDNVPSAQPYVVVHEAPPLNPSKRAADDRPIIEFEFIDYADLVKYPDALREIYRGDRGGLVIRGVYSKDEMARVVERLEGGQTNFPMMHLPPSQRSYFLGLCLEGGDPSLKDYLEAAERFREQARHVYDGMPPFEERLESVFRALAGGRGVELARFPDGRAYTPATIRILPVGGQLAPHCGNEMYNRPSYEHLNSFVDNNDQISYFLTLQEAEEGGGLIIYSLKWAEVGADHILPDERSNVGLLLADAEWMEVRPQVGDVLVFDGGRYLHRVDWVRGGRTRWTMGGFLQFDKAGERVLYFA